jgi:hypothetical protein
LFFYAILVPKKESEAAGYSVVVQADTGGLLTSVRGPFFLGKEFREKKENFSESVFHTVFGLSRRCGFGIGIDAVVFYNIDNGLEHAVNRYLL